MAEPASGSEAPAHRRDRRRERKKARVRRVVAVVAGTMLVVVALLVATDVLRVGGHDTPLLAGTVDTSAPEQAAPSTTSDAHPCRALTVDQPLRLWVAGDSLAGSLGPSLGDVAGGTGVVQPYFDSRVSSGLDDPGFFDWPAHATSEIARLHPEVVVFIIGANDWSVPGADDQWKVAYTKRVEQMLSSLEGDGRYVYWVGAPILRDSKMDDGVAKIDALTAEIVKQHPDVHYVDAYKLFSDSNGEYATNLPDATGKVVAMRAGDGVHLTPAGGDLLAGAVFRLLDAKCHVTEQKVDGVTKRTIETEGSTQVAPNSLNGSGNGTVQTLPPATNPPTTTTRPPVTAPPITAPPTTVAPTTTTSRPRNQFQFP